MLTARKRWRGTCLARDWIWAAVTQAVVLLWVDLCCRSVLSPRGGRACAWPGSAWTCSISEQSCFMWPRRVIPCFSQGINHRTWLEDELETGSRVSCCQAAFDFLWTPWQRHCLCSCVKLRQLSQAAARHDAAGLGSCWRPWIVPEKRGLKAGFCKPLPAILNGKDVSLATRWKLPSRAYGFHRL